MKEISIGFVPIKIDDEKVLYLLVLNKSGDHWGFPKGHVEKDEDFEKTARRELKEETGLNLKKIISTKILEENYEFEKNSQIISKQVFYQIAEVDGIVKIDNVEVVDYEFLEFKKAYDKITHLQSKNILSKAKGEIDAFLQKEKN